LIDSTVDINTPINNPVIPRILIPSITIFAKRTYLITISCAQFASLVYPPNPHAICLVSSGVFAKPPCIPICHKDIYPEKGRTKTPPYDRYIFYQFKQCKEFPKSCFQAGMISSSLLLDFGMKKFEVLHMVVGKL